MQTALWGGPLDGCEINVDEPPKTELEVGQFTGWTSYATEIPEVIKHHYVWDMTTHRYNYAGDWPR